MSARNNSRELPPRSLTYPNGDGYRILTLADGRYCYLLPDGTHSDYFYGSTVSDLPLVASVLSDDKIACLLQGGQKGIARMLMPELELLDMMLPDLSGQAELPLGLPAWVASICDELGNRGFRGSEILFIASALQNVENLAGAKGNPTQNLQEAIGYLNQVVTSLKDRS